MDERNGNGLNGYHHMSDAPAPPPDNSILHRLLTAPTNRREAMEGLSALALHIQSNKMEGADLLWQIQIIIERDVKTLMIARRDEERKRTKQIDRIRAAVKEVGGMNLLREVQAWLKDHPEEAST